MHDQILVFCPERHRQYGQISQRVFQWKADKVPNYRTEQSDQKFEKMRPIFWKVTQNYCLIMIAQIESSI